MKSRDSSFLSFVSIATMSNPSSGCFLFLVNHAKVLVTVGAARKPDPRAIRIIVDRVPWNRSQLDRSRQSSRPCDLQDFKNASPTIARLFGNPSPIASTPPTHILKAIPRSAGVQWRGGTRGRTHDDPLEVRPRLKSADAMLNALPLRTLLRIGWPWPSPGSGSRRSRRWRWGRRSGSFRCQWPGERGQLKDRV